MPSRVRVSVRLSSSLCLINKTLKMPVTCFSVLTWLVSNTTRTPQNEETRLWGLIEIVIVHVCAFEHVWIYVCSVKHVLLLLVCHPAEGNISQHSDGLIVKIPTPRRGELNRCSKKMCLERRRKRKRRARRKMWIRGYVQIKVSKTVTPHEALYGNHTVCTCI